MAPYSGRTLELVFESGFSFLNGCFSAQDRAVKFYEGAASPYTAQRGI